MALVKTNIRKEIINMNINPEKEQQSIIECLFYDISSDSSLYQEYDGSKMAKEFSNCIKQFNLDFTISNKLEAQFSAAETEAEQHGFQQGLKLGLRLMAAAMNGTNP